MGLLLLLALAASAGADVATPRQALFATYAERTRLLDTSPATSSTGLLGYINPALLARLKSPESLLFRRAGDEDAVSAPSWALFSAVPHLGLATIYDDGLRDREIRLSLGLGGDTASLGVSWGWFDGPFFLPEASWTVGAVWQPTRRWSMGSTWTATADGDIRELASEVGWRPAASTRLTLFAEGAHAWGRSQHALGRGDVDVSSWRIGTDVGLGPGVHLTGSYDNRRTMHIGLRMEAGTIGGRAGVLNKRNGSARILYGLRLGPDRGNLGGAKKTAFLQLDLRGPVRHRSYPLFDDGRSLLELLTTLRRAETDPALAGVAINLSGLRLDPAMSWELRQQLQAVRDAGRTVVVYIDRVDLRGYHLASVADVIVLDPSGLIVLQGFAAGQVYLKGALDKLGIGSQEWRYHEFKSAFESVNRTGMSDHDRRQWQALLDDDYHRARLDITAIRGLTDAAFDSLVNDVTGLLPADALAVGLVDSVGRWQSVERIVTQQGGSAGLVQAEDLPHRAREQWGATPTVAVLYALGVCAMDNGIRARDLATELRRLAQDGNVSAVVLRVDSPGGDVLASDLVADAVAACRAHKPVIVSQARFAASGGYWISMESDAILATPATITGSIGVIGGWLYNQGFRERLGLTVDHVQVGDHADLGLGMPLPLLGMPLPDRALTEQEVRRTDRVLTAMYDGFVNRVATARQRTPAQIDSVARGRVWSGGAAIERGLVDSLGGLQAAIALAARRAGIAPDRSLRITEWPRLGWFSLRDWPGLIRSGLPTRTQAAPPAWLSLLQFRLQHNGQPLIMLSEPLLDQFGVELDNRP
jgi:protease IV